MANINIKVSHQTLNDQLAYHWEALEDGKESTLSEEIKLAYEEEKARRSEIWKARWWARTGDRLAQKEEFSRSCEPGHYVWWLKEHYYKKE